MIDSIILRGTERILVVIGGIISIYLGYKLYKFGINEGISKIDLKYGKFERITLSGAGPGVFLIAIGGIILLYSLITGGAHLESNDPTRLQGKTTIEDRNNKPIFTDKDIEDITRIPKNLKDGDKMQ